MGIHVTNSFKDLFCKNFQPLLDKCKLDLSRWASLPLSVAGRTNLIKMIILPKLLYLFQHIPVFINKTFFVRLDRLLSSFLWNNKPARLKRTILQLPKSEGGLALPNFHQYYWACNIAKLLFWLNCNSLADCPPGVHIELSSSKSSLSSVICSQLPVNLSNISNNPVVSDAIKIWLQFRKRYGLHRASTCAPVLSHCFK